MRTGCASARRAADALRADGHVVEQDGRLVRGVCCNNPSYIAHVFWTGTQFLLFRENTVWASTNGVQWAQQAGSGIDRFTAMARDPATGTIVAARADAPTKFFRSTDGLRWTALAAANYDARGAEIKYITFGHGRPSARCPLP